MEQVETGLRWLPDQTHVADERTMLVAMLEWHREGVVAKVTGLAPELLTTSPVVSGTSIAGLLKHLALVEDSWFAQRLGRQPMPEPWRSAPFDEDADWDFHSATEPLPELIGLYQAACARSREVIQDLPLDARGSTERGLVFTLRFALLHLIEETARHLGHLDILRELQDNVTGE